MMKKASPSNVYGHYGVFGGRYVGETLMPALIEVDAAYAEAVRDPSFQRELDELLSDYVGRPSPLYLAARLTASCGGATLYLKREDLNHTGAHKINSTVGQALLARRMGKHRLMAETGAGQHGVATATAAALLGMECDIYMGAVDIKRQAPNVRRMELLGAHVHAVRSGTETLKDAMSEAMRAWVTRVADTYYVIGTVAGPHPYPRMVRDFQAVIGRETREQCLRKTDRLPDLIVACIGGGSNAAGIFHPFLEDRGVKKLGVEAAGRGLDSGEHAASISAGRIGILHGSKSFVLQTRDGQICNAHSISAGLDYPGVGPELVCWAEQKRIELCAVTDDDALTAFHRLTRLEGILPALESSHALFAAMERAAGMPKDSIVIVNLSGRGDKDVATVLESGHNIEH